MEIKKVDELTELDRMILDLIPKKRENAIRSKELTLLTGIKFRKLKIIISKLRKYYPICAQENINRGYWITEDEEEIHEYILMLKKRILGTQKTINSMLTHIETRGRN